jgi:hypothetical protein
LTPRKWSDSVRHLPIRLDRGAAPSRRPYPASSMKKKKRTQRRVFLSRPTDLSGRVGSTTCRTFPRRPRPHRLPRSRLCYLFGPTSYVPSVLSKLRGHANPGAAHSGACLHSRRFAGAAIACLVVSGRPSNAANAPPHALALGKALVRSWVNRNPADFPTIPGGPAPAGASRRTSRPCRLDGIVQLVSRVPTSCGAR